MRCCDSVSRGMGGTSGEEVMVFFFSSVVGRG